MEQNIQVAQNQGGVGNAVMRKLGLVLSVFLFVLPIFFVPSESVGLYVAKVTLLATGLVAVFALYLSTVLSTGTIELPKAKYLIPMILFAVVALVSSAFSGTIVDSIAGSVFDLGTSGSILMLVFAMFMTILSAKNIGTVNRAVSAIIYSLMVLAGYTVLGTFAGSVLPASLASKMPLFLGGGIVDMSIIFGAGVILALCAINMSPLSRKMKYLLPVFMGVALLFVGAANFMPVIVILGLVSLIFFVYILSWSVGKAENVERSTDASPMTEAGTSQGRQISISSLIILVFSIVLLLGGTNISGYASRLMRIQTVEIRPNFEATMNLATVALRQNFALGIGPNRFAEFWSAHKPIEINQTQFWNSDFYSGSGFVPTIAITTGLLGLLSLLAFMGMYAVNGVKAMFAQVNSNKSRYLATSTFLVSVYLWIMLFLYSPGITVLALAFIFTGLFTATLIPQGIIGSWKVNIFANPKANFLTVLSAMILLVLSVAGGYFVWERAIASTVFQSGVIGYQKDGNIALVRESTIKAINLVPTDVYWRGLTEIFITDLSRVMGSVTNQNQMTDALRTEIQTLVVNSVESAKKATEVGSRNFQNWFALGRVYEILAQNGVEGALENARSAYAEAGLRAPTNPAVPLALARLDVMGGEAKKAKENISKAISLKNNYTDAYFTLAQIEVASNTLRGAITSVEQASFLDPNNAQLFFQLGLLKYNARDFAGSASAFERSVTLVPDYANPNISLGFPTMRLIKRRML